MVRIVASLLLSASVIACSSSGDAGALLLESADACARVCTDHPDVDAVSYEAGGGSPLLFSGRVATSCSCSGAGRPVTAAPR